MSGIAFNESLILGFDRPMTDREVLSAMTDYLYEEGIIKDIYKRAVLGRKQPFPTGLKIGGIDVAIPHADICHVNGAVIYVTVLKTPASFRAMDEPDNDVPVNLIIMLALTEAHGHIEILQRIVKLIQNQEDMKRIMGAGQPDTIHKIIKQYLLEDENQKRLSKEKIKVKRVLVTCGNGITTSTVVATKIRGKCEDSRIPVSVTQYKLLEAESKAGDFDSLVTTGRFTGGNVNIPVIGAISLLTGIDEDATLDEILSHLR